jgi:hypothetical protein
VFNDLITQVLSLLMKQELVDLHRVAQDGSRVRASARVRTGHWVVGEDPA